MLRALQAAENPLAAQDAQEERHRKPLPIVQAHCMLALRLMCGASAVQAMF